MKRKTIRIACDIIGRVGIVGTAMATDIGPALNFCDGIPEGPGW